MPKRKLQQEIEVRKQQEIGERNGKKTIHPTLRTTRSTAMLIEIKLLQCELLHIGQLARSCIKFWNEAKQKVNSEGTGEQKTEGTTEVNTAGRIEKTEQSRKHKWNILYGSPTLKESNM